MVKGVQVVTRMLRLRLLGAFGSAEHIPGGKPRRRRCGSWQVRQIPMADMANGGGT